MVGNKQEKLDVWKIKQHINAYDFYLKELNLDRYGHRSGSWFVAGLCPFHNDGSPGSFKVCMATGAFKCWSCGVGGGDVIAFLQQRDGTGFFESLRKLSQDWGGV